MMYDITMRIQSCCVPRDVEHLTYIKAKYGTLDTLHEKLKSSIYDRVYAATAADEMTAMAFNEEP